MQMEELKRTRSDREGLRGAFQASMTPAQTMQPDPYEFDGMRDGSMPQPFTKPGGFDTQGFLGRAAPFMDPMQAVQFQQQIANANKPDLMVLPEGGTLIDKRNPNKGPVATGAPKLPPGMVMGPNGPEYMPAYLSGQEQIRRAGRPEGFTIHNIGEREEQKKLGGLRVDNFAGVQALAASARKENALLTGLERIPLETGKLTPANATVAAWLTAAGAKAPDLQRIASGAQTFEAFTNDLVMQQQLAQKGPQTESDAKRLQMTQAQLSNTPEANKLNITYRKAMNNRTIEQERFYAQWLAKNKTLDGAEDAWFNGKGGTSIWDEPALKKFQAQATGVLRFDSQGNQIP